MSEQTGPSLPIPEGSIVITPAQFYESTQRAVGQIQTDVSDLKAVMSSVPRRLDDHETRIRKLERALWIGVGAAATVGGAIGSAAGTAFASMAR